MRGGMEVIGLAAEVTSAKIAVDAHKSALQWRTQDREWRAQDIQFRAFELRVNNRLRVEREVDLKTQQLKTVANLSALIAGFGMMVSVCLVNVCCTGQCHSLPCRLLHTLCLLHPLCAGSPPRD